MKKFLYLLPLMLALTCTSSRPWAAYNTAEIRSKWEDQIAAFDVLNQRGLPKDPILFYGSSSIRMWNSIEADLSPMSVVKRGYGGASLHDAAYYAKRVLSPIPYKALAIFVANDIWGTPQDKSPAEIEKFLHYIVTTSRKQRPQAPIFLVEVTHVPARAHLMKEWDAANARIKAYAERYEDVHFIPTRDLYVTPEGSIRNDLFLGDQLHQNAAGYSVWTDRIKTFLQATLSGA